MEKLIAEIERTGSGRPIPGIGGDLGDAIFATPCNAPWKLAIWRAVQNLAVTRPWMNNAADATQGELFEVRP
jgi:hypothetical protein